MGVSPKKKQQPSPGTSGSMKWPVLIAILTALLVVPEPGTIPATEFVYTQGQTPNTIDLDAPLFKRTNIAFPCSGERCEAWLYVPKATAPREPGGAHKPPVVIMAHGMGGQRDTGLHKYASYLADAGLAVFAFDYRGFGGSGGLPRHWVSPKRHAQDWGAAFDFLTAPEAPEAGQQETQEAVDASRVILWGTSFGAGHALTIAPTLGPRIKAVVAQVPHLNATAATLRSVEARGIPKSIRMLLLGLKDKARHALGLPPLYVPLAGPPGSLALMQLEGEDMEHYMANRPQGPQGGWRNMACARLSAELTLEKYSPINAVPKIEAPVLFVASTQDKLCPFDQVKRAVDAAKNGSLISREVAHFYLTSPSQLPSLMAEQIAWLRGALGLPSPDGASGAHPQQLLDGGGDDDETGEGVATE